jgi:polar amino acid transport system permease protein
MSSLISVIGLGDLTRRANELIVTTYRPLEIYSFLVLEYLILVIFASYLVRRIEKKFQIK